MMAREHEMKLAVDDAFELPSFDGAVADATQEPSELREIDDVYFDTTDLRLFRWGCTLRQRNGDVWTVKLPVGTRGEALVRDEIDFVGIGASPPAAAAELVSSFSRGAPLRVVARAHTHRVAQAWRSLDGRPVVEVVDDRVQSTPTVGPRVEFRQVEVELAPDAAPSTMDEIIRRLTLAGARPDLTGPKLGYALGESAQGPPDVVQTAVETKPAVRAVIKAALSRSVRQLVAELPNVHLGSDIEGVHQARVAIRRLRSDLKTFKPFLDPLWVATMEPELRSLGARLGSVRDADVLAVRLRSTLAIHPRISAAAGRRVVAVLEAERADAVAGLLQHLRGDSTSILLDQLVRAATRPMVTPEADKSAKDLLPTLVRKRWRQLDKAVKALGAEPPIEALHNVRILAKRVRYAAEALSVFVGPKARAFADAVADIQNVLGELHDAATTEEWLLGAIDRMDPHAAFTAGQIAELTRAEAIRYRHGWEAPYAKAAQKRLRSWFR